MLNKLFLPVTSILLFLSSISNAIEIKCPDKAPTGSPVMISYEGIPEGAATKVIKKGFKTNDTFLELFDANGKAVTIFWSLEPGPRSIQLIVCTHASGMSIQEDTHILNYGKDIVPPPIPVPLPILTAYISANSMDQTDLLNLSEFYSDFADELEKSNLENTAQFREAYIAAGTEFFESTNIKGKYAGLADIIDKILADSLSLNIVLLDKVKTSKLLREISLTFGGKL
jgi:hypothetical protein